MCACVRARAQLTWVWSQGSATLDVAFTAAKIKLVTTTMQAVVLLHLQQGRCSVGKLATITGIDAGLLKHVVGSLATVKGLTVVAKKPAGPRVQEADEVEIDWAFKSPKRVRDGAVRVPWFGEVFAALRGAVCGAVCVLAAPSKSRCPHPSSSRRTNAWTLRSPRSARCRWTRALCAR